MFKINIYMQLLAGLIFVHGNDYIEAAENSWSTSGPEGGSIYNIAIHPQDHRIIYVSTIEDGIFRSGDSGESWNHLPSGGFAHPTMRTIAIHPFGPDTMYATTINGMYKSTDAGQSWELLPNPDGPYMEYRPFVIHPLSPNILYSAGWLHAWKSTDGGQSWYMMLVPGPDPRFISVWDYAIDPLRPNIMYLAGSSDTFRRALFKSTDYGESWLSCMNNIDTSGTGRRIVIDPVNTDILYFVRNRSLANTRCLWKSTNGGDSWADITPAGMGLQGMNDLLVLPQEHNTLLACTQNDGILKSTDGGSTWNQSSAGLRIGQMSTIKVDTVDNMIFLGTFIDGMYKSTDEGTSWRPISYNLFHAWCYDLALNPLDAQNIFVTVPNGPFISTDSGASWRYVDAGLPRNWRTSGVACDALSPGVIYMSLYRYRISSGLLGFARSIDGGLTWSFTDNGLPGDVDFGRIAISYSGDRRRIFLTSTRGLFKSDDAGISWAPCQGGLPSDNSYRCIAVAPNNSNLIAVGEGWRPSPAIQNYVYLSSDRGESWANATILPEGSGSWIDEVKFSPSDDNHLYAICFIVGLFETLDRGQTWTNITSGIPIDPAYPDEPWLSGLEINPQDPSNLFIISALMGIYQSHDGGQTWESFNSGLDTTFVGGKISFAPGDTTHLYLASDTRSVWSIHRTATGIENDEPILPEKISLSSYPNPFNSLTIITVKGINRADIGIYDISGRLITTLLAENGKAVWDAHGLGSGVYFARLKSQMASESIRMILLK